MTVFEFAKKYNLEVLSEGDTFMEEIQGCFAGDLLSLAMSGVNAKDAWVTVQTNMNILGIAALTDASCIIVANNMSVSDEVINKAKEEKICLLHTKLTMFELCCRLGEII